MNTEWSTGYFVGLNGKTTEYVVATADGVFSCATIRRLPDDEAYDPECINIVKSRTENMYLEVPAQHQWEFDLAKPTPRTLRLTPLQLRWCPDGQDSSQKTLCSSVIP